MTDITAKPFDWNDNLSKEAIEDFEEIQKDLPYCTCQSIGMALAKLELLEKQGCKALKPKSEWQQDHEILKAYSDGASMVLDKIRERVELEKLGYPPSAGYYKAIVKVLQIIDSEGGEE